MRTLSGPTSAASFCAAFRAGPPVLARRSGPGRTVVGIAAAFGLVAALLAACSPPGNSERSGAASAVPRRVVSLNPSLSSIVVELGASDALVGLDDASARAFPALASLPLVGGLFNPSLEAVVALQPDWVVLVPSVEQRDFAARLGAFGIDVEAFPNDALHDVIATIEAFGERLGPQARRRATQRIAAIERTRAAVARVAARYEAPNSLIVLQRDPLYVVGPHSFLAEMLSAVGARNAARVFDEAYPRVGVEWLVEAAPQLILDSSFDAELGTSFWERWPSIPAVAEKRVVPLREQVVTLPGPHVDEALLLLLRAVHGESAASAARSEIRAEQRAAESLAQRELR